MKSIQDALYNWLTIKVVVDARPDDTAAVETFEFFDQILKDEHQIEDLEISKDEDMYYLTYSLQGEQKKSRYPIELIDIMHDQIQQEPEKYKNYPEK
jgi:hypothetical protein